MQCGICYLDWWPELLVFSDQKGAVTAEFMLLFPTVVLALAGVLGVFQLGVAQLELTRNAFTQARQLSIGASLIPIDGVEFQSYREGQLVCVIAQKRLAIDLEARACLFQHGS
jgi:hypothetical protein